MKIQLHSSTGTRRLWNPIIAEYYEYEKRPTVDEDGQIELIDDCGKRLIERYPSMTAVEPEPEPEDDSTDDADAQTAEVTRPDDGRFGGDDQ